MPSDNRHYEKIGSDVRNIDDEIPFDIPESWVWVRVGTIANIFTGDSINKDEKAKKYIGLAEGYNYIATKDIDFDHTINYNNGVKIPFAISSKFSIANVGMPLLCIEGGSAGHKIGILSENVCFGNKLCAFETYLVNQIFLFFFLQTPNFIKIFKINTTGIIGGVSVDKIKKFLFPLPPLTEQERIVLRIEKFEPLIDEYDKYEQEKSRLNIDLPDRLRKSILQYAIQGKLVPQDPADEPATELLKRIHAEKELLIKSGKIKRERADSYIYKGDDNSYYQDNKNIDGLLPFDIPDSWAWCRLGEIVDFSKNESVSVTKINENAWILDLEDIEKDTGKLLCKKRMKNTSSKSDKHIFQFGDVLYSKLRPYLNKVIIADENGYCTSEILAFNFGLISNEYAQIYFMSPFFIEYAMSDAYGVKMPRMGSSQGNAAFMPIPPFAEQVRIVEAVNKSKEILQSLQITK